MKKPTKTAALLAVACLVAALASGLASGVKAEPSHAPYLENATEISRYFYQGLSSFADESGKYGFVREDGRVAIPAIYDEVGDFSSLICVAAKDGVHGILDIAGNFTPVSPWSEHYILTNDDAFNGIVVFRDLESRKYGAITLQGHLITPAQWDSIGLTGTEGGLTVEKDGRYGIIDERGQQMIGLAWEYAGFFSGGLARVKENGLYGYVDHSGDLAIPAAWADAGDFNGGAAPVMTVIDGKERWGLIDMRGRLLTGLEWQTAHAVSARLFVVELDGKFGLVDSGGRTLASPVWGRILKVSDGLFSVYSGNRYGLMDDSGRLLQPPQWEALWDFSKGIALVEGENGNGFIDERGELLSEPEWDSDYYQYTNSGISDASITEYMTYLREGMISVYKGEQYGFLDAGGKVAVPPVWDFATDFSEGLAIVQQNEKTGYVNREGEVVIPLVWGEASAFQYGVAPVKEYVPDFGPGLWGLIDRGGKVLVETKWTDTPIVGRGVVFAPGEDDRYQVYDYQGNRLSGR